VATPNFTTATVTSVLPLTVRVSGDTTNNTPAQDFVGGLALGDVVMAAFVGNSLFITQRAARRTPGARGLYMPTPSALTKWNYRLAYAQAGTKSAHIAVVGDSIAYGAAATGVSVPKYANSWPGFLRSMIGRQFGSSGTGVVIADAVSRANPTFDPRWAFSGTITDQGFGFHKAACYRLNASGNYAEFTATCDTFEVMTFASEGSPVDVKIDGTSVGTISNRRDGTGGTITRDTRSFVGVASAENFFSISAGTGGSHTIRLTNGASGSTFLASVEGKVTSNSVVRVSNPSINGKSLDTLWAGAAKNDETNGLYGLPLIDSLRADLLVIALGTNDWQAGVDASVTKSQLATLIARQRAYGTNDGGAPKANGEVLLLWPPLPDVTALGESHELRYWYRRAMYDVANENNVALLDLEQLWGGYSEANSRGLFADTIHPSTAGSADIANAVMTAIAP